MCKICAIKKRTHSENRVLLLRPIPAQPRTNALVSLLVSCTDAYCISVAYKQRNRGVYSVVLEWDEVTVPYFQNVFFFIAQILSHTFTQSHTNSHISHTFCGMARTSAGVCVCVLCALCALCAFRVRLCVLFVLRVVPQTVLALRGS